jgi:hypothetical protein
VAAIVALAWSLFRRQAGRASAACLAVCVFLVLSWYRLVQLRPELFSIAATLALQRLLFEPALPSWRRVAAAAALIAVWANVHALFMVGPLLIVAALAGLGAQALLAHIGRRRGLVANGPGEEARRALRLGAALLLGLVAALANPRGAAQHLAFLTSSREGAIWTVLDEWAAFDPLSWSNYAPAVSGLAWVVTDLLLVALLAVAVRAVVRAALEPSAARLRAADPMGLALAGAGALAMLTSIRFLWMSVFPLLFLLREQRLALGAHLVAAGRAGGAYAAACLGLALAFPFWGGFGAVAALFPREPRAYLTDAYTGHRFFEEGVSFLAQTGVEGNLFHPDSLGGFLCHQLAPRVRTFVDGSMNHPDAVVRDYHHINLQRGTWPYETFLDVLDRRRVDLVFGVGVPVGGRRTTEEGLYTTANLERAPGWILVSRSMRHAIHLRANARNRENLVRIAAWYESQQIPFDPERGLDPDAVVQARPGWAVRQRMLFRGHAELLAASEAADPEQRFAARETLGLAYALVGAYQSQIHNDRVSAGLRPDAKAPLRRLVYGLLRLGRDDEAVQTARRLLTLDSRDPRSVVFVRIAEAVWRRGQQPRNTLQQATPLQVDAPVNVLPLLRSRQPLQQ